jgi:hypothetical protein
MIRRKRRSLAVLRLCFLARVVLRFPLLTIVLCTCLVPSRAAALAAERENSAIVTGRILRAGNREPIAAAIVVVQASDPAIASIASSTDENGTFALSVSLLGDATLFVRADGYLDQRDPIRIVDNNNLEVEIYLKPGEQSLYRMVVTSDRRNQSPSQQRLSAEELRILPGAYGDPLRAVSALPGLARAPFSSGLIVARGSAPRNSLVVLGGHEIPRLYHFGGINTVFHAAIVDSISLMSSNFSARYGNAIGGLIDVTLASPTGARAHGQVELSLLDLNGLIQKQIGATQVTVGIRRSHVDGILRGLAALSGRRGFREVLPRYWDYQAVVATPVAGGKMTLRALGAQDILTMTGKRDKFVLTNGFHRLDAAFEKRWSSRVRLQATPSFAWDQDRYHWGRESTEFVSKASANFRGEVEARFNSRLSLAAGTELRYRWLRSNLNDSSEDADALRQGVHSSRFLPAAFGGATLHLGQIELVSEVRLTRFGVGPSPISVDPRLRTVWQPSNKWSIQAGTGWFSQDAPASVFVAAPIESLPRESAAFSHNFLPEKALHNAVGIQLVPRDGLTVSMQGYYKQMWNVINLPWTTELLAPSLRPDATLASHRSPGRAYGLEFGVRKNLNRHFFGWLSYALTRSERRLPSGRTWVPFDFDQPHALTAVVGWKLPRDFRVSSKFRLSSGNPYTPCLHEVQEDPPAPRSCVGGATRSARSPAFHQLDLRLEKTWLKRRSEWVLYLDVFNVYNQDNVEFSVAQPDAGVAAVPSLPFLPVAGLRVNY